MFTGDGRLMALGIAPDQVLLADAATGRELARLTTLQSVTPTPLAFSPDGTKLVAATRQKTVLVWDLRRIRDQLAPMGLDWDAPPYPASTASAAGAAAGPMPPPRPVRVVGEVIEPQARRKAERAEMDRRLAANPDDAEALIHRGWLSLTERRLARGDRRPRSVSAGDNPTTPTSTGCWARRTRTRATWLVPWPSQPGARASARGPRHPFRARAARLRPWPHAAGCGRFRRVLAAEPTRDLARYHRARALNRLGRYREALADLDVSDRQKPERTSCCTSSAARPTRPSASTSRRGSTGRRPAPCCPRDPNRLNNQAWSLATGSLAQRDPERAVALARQAVALAPDQSIYLNTLGVALYRAGRYAEAVDVLERSLAAGRGEFDAFDLFFLAMAHHQLGIIRARPEPASTGPCGGGTGKRHWCRNMFRS